MFRRFTLIILASGVLCGQEQTGAPCDLTLSNSLDRSAREAMAGRHYNVAASRFEAAYTACPRQASILLELSQAQTLERNFEQAIAAARRYLEADPGSVPGKLALANACFMAQRFHDARGTALQILKAEPGNSAALKIKGNAEYLSGDANEAINTFVDLLDRHPEDSEAAYMLGRIYYQESMVDQAIGQFERVLRTDPRSYKSYDNLGLCFEAKGDNDKATRYFLMAIKVAEENHAIYDWPYANLSDLLFKTGDPERAFDAASKAANLNPQSARDFYLGGKALEKLGKTDLALNWLHRSTALDPAYAEPEYLLAQIYNRLGQQEKADAARKRFLAAKSRLPAARR
jgi:tetratricopeptide (TPR) repeat protein